MFVLGTPVVEEMPQRLRRATGGVLPVGRVHEVPAMSPWTAFGPYRRVIRPHGAGRPGLARTASTTISRAVCGGGR